MPRASPRGVSSSLQAGGGTGEENTGEGAVTVVKPREGFVVVLCCFSQKEEMLS